MLHVWNIYLHLSYKLTIHVGKYTSPMDPTGYCLFFVTIPTWRWTPPRNSLQKLVFGIIDIFHSKKARQNNL